MLDGEKGYGKKREGEKREDSTLPDDKVLYQFEILT